MHTMSHNTLLLIQFYLYQYHEQKTTQPLMVFILKVEPIKIEIPIFILPCTNCPKGNLYLCQIILQPRLSNINLPLMVFFLLLEFYLSNSWNLINKYYSQPLEIKYIIEIYINNQRFYQMAFKQTFGSGPTYIIDGPINII